MLAWYVPGYVEISLKPYKNHEPTPQTPRKIPTGKIALYGSNLRVIA
jgi:hypothetical protein